MNETVLQASDIDTLVFNTAGLIPVVAQDSLTKTVLMLAYANQEAIRLTLSSGQAHYYSRSRQRLWRKGETSGQTQSVTAVYFDCDRDALLYSVRQEGVACHTGRYSCFGDSCEAASLEEADPLQALQAIVKQRQQHPKEGSYTNYLLDKGLDKILKKVGEENAEVIIAAKNQDKGEIGYETADLLYHLSVLLTERGIDWCEVYAELAKRRG